MNQEHILYLIRHWDARPASLPGTEAQVVGAPEGQKMFAGGGKRCDGKTHLKWAEHEKAYKSGTQLWIPEGVESVQPVYSDEPRAIETVMSTLDGMIDQYARAMWIETIHAIPSKHHKQILSSEGLQTKIRKPMILDGLREPAYLDSQLVRDEGDELVRIGYYDGPDAEKVHRGFKGFKFGLQHAIEGGKQSEHPYAIAERALRDIMPLLIQHDVVIGGGHHPSIDLLGALLLEEYDLSRVQDANEPFKRLGGDFKMGEMLRLKIKIVGEEIVHAEMGRLKAYPTIEHHKLEVDVDRLRAYATPKPFEPVCSE